MNECARYLELKIKQSYITFQFHGLSGYTGPYVISFQVQLRYA